MSEQIGPKQAARIEASFGIKPDTLAEIQKKMCARYDESRADSDFTSAQAWFAVSAYIDAAINPNPLVQGLHDMQRNMLRMGLHPQMRDRAIEALDEGIESGDPRGLARGVGMFFSANFDDLSKAVAFTETVQQEIEGILASQGM